MSISIKWHTRVIVAIHQVGCCTGCCSCRWTSTGRYATSTATTTAIVTVTVATMIIHHSSRCCCCCCCVMICLIFIVTMICE